MKEVLAAAQPAKAAAMTMKLAFVHLVENSAEFTNVLKYNLPFIFSLEVFNLKTFNFFLFSICEENNTISGMLFRKSSFCKASLLTNGTWEIFQQRNTEALYANQYIICNFYAQKRKKNLLNFHAQFFFFFIFLLFLLHFFSRVLYASDNTFWLKNSSENYPILPGILKSDINLYFL